MGPVPAFPEVGAVVPLALQLFCRNEPSTALGRSVLLSSFFAQAAEVNQIAGKVTQLNDNGAWSWFINERAIVDRGQLLIGSVRANGRFEQNQLPGWGDVELAVLNLNSGRKEVIKLHEHFEQDDHDNPGLITLPDGHYLAMYSKHGREAKFYYRISTEPGKQNGGWREDVDVEADHEQLDDGQFAANRSGCSGQTILCWMRGSYRCNRGEWGTGSWCQYWMQETFLDNPKSERELDDNRMKIWDSAVLPNDPELHIHCPREPCRLYLC